jgi:hypothetical protein
VFDVRLRFRVGSGNRTTLVRRSEKRCEGNDGE